MTFDRLRSAEGEALLAQIAAAMSDATPPDLLALGQRLRAHHSPELVAAAMGQHELRARAAAKFGPSAATMFFTRDALEQSTRARVADHRARHLVSLGATAVVDLGCGIGADLLAMARAGLVVRGVDSDPVRVAMARANAEALGLSVEVSVGDAEATSIAPGEVAFIDPARRDAHGRTFSLDDLSPSWEFTAAQLAGRAVAKVMPGIAHSAVPTGVEAEWVSDGGDLVEACLWGAVFSTGSRRRATVLPDDVRVESRDEPAVVGECRDFIVEPDDAVIRAGLVAEFAADVGGQLLDPHVAYVTTDAPPTAPAASLGRWFRVVEELPYRTKALKAALRERDVGALTVKKRGVEIVPEQFIARLGLRGSRPATLIMTRVADRGTAFLVDPVSRQ